MEIEVRIYRRYDADLLALCDAGYSIMTMLRDSVIAYANGRPLHYLIDKAVPFNPIGKKTVHTRFTVPDSDVRTCYMLKNIKKSFRNMFVKTVLRNALIQQNLGIFFTDPNLLQYQNIGIYEKMSASSYQNVIPCSSVVMHQPSINFLGREIGIQYTQATGTYSASAQFIQSQTPQAPMPQMNPVYTPEPIKSYQAPVMPAPLENMAQASLISSQVHENVKIEQPKEKEEVFEPSSSAHIQNESINKKPENAENTYAEVDEDDILAAFDSL